MSAVEKPVHDTGIFVFLPPSGLYVEHLLCLNGTGGESSPKSHEDEGAGASSLLACRKQDVSLMSSSILAEEKPEVGSYQCL